VKVPIGLVDVVNLDAPVLPAYEKKSRGVVRWLVWCKHCGTWHRHGAGEGHREAYCLEQQSPYYQNGYNLAYAGRWRDRPRTS
jgi:hypothetical protein